jgi:hypothetical protein
VTTNLRRSAVAASIASLVVVAAACSGGGDAEPTTTPPTTAAPTTTTTTTTLPPTTTSTTVVETTTTTTEAVIPRMPLTGDVLTDPSVVPNRPALVVKIGNNPGARPQAGLESTDIVFEENTEGITRFAAVFHSQDSDLVGPVRSGRTQDVDMLAPLYNPLFGWSGGNGGVRAAVRESTLVDLDAGFTPGYYRRSGRGGSPDNLYTSTEALWASTPPEFSVPPEIFPYVDPGVVVEGEPATVVRVPMDGVLVTWEYDPAIGMYRRFQNGSPHVTENGEQIVTRNIVVMAVEYRPSRVDRNSPEAQTVGGGPVHVFSSGVMRAGTWIHFVATDPYGLIVEPAAEGADVQELGLEPGRTWVELARDAEFFVSWE